MTAVEADGHVHGHVHGNGHIHAHDVPSDPFWAAAGEAYAGLRTATQLLAGLELLGVDGGARTDLRQAVGVRVKLLLVEVGDALNRIQSPPAVGDYIRELFACRDDLTEIAHRQSEQLDHRSLAVAPRQTQRMLELVTDRLRRCERYDRGLRFFGSGGCADIEHALSHLHN